MADVTPANLARSLLSAGEGATLRLAPGDYPRFRIEKGMMVRRRRPLTLVPADPASPPRFVQTLNLDAWSNVTFRGIDFDISTAGATGTPAVSIRDGENIAILGGRVTGRRTPDDRWGYGVKAKGVAGLAIREVAFSTLRRCIGLGDCDDVEIVGNDFSGIGTDGIDLGGIVRGLIARNFLTDFNPVGKDHPDAIQIMQVNGQRGCQSLKILDNFILCGHVGRVRAQGTFGTGDTHQDIEVGGNTYVDTNWNGIKLYDMKEVAVHDNIVLFIPEVPLRERAATKSWIDFERCEGRAWNNRAMKISLNGMVDGGGNKEIPAANQKQVDRALAAWRAKFRPGAAPPAAPERPTRRSAFDHHEGPQLAAATLFLRLGEA